MRQTTIFVVALALGATYAALRATPRPAAATMADWTGESNDESRGTVLSSTSDSSREHACFAGGCFWSVEALFDAVPGVVDTVPGFIDGVETVWVAYDGSRVTYENLLSRYWRGVDPFTATRQFCDVGEAYRPVIFAASERQRTAAETSRGEVERHFGRPVAVTIRDEARFVAASRAHQDFARRHPVQYAFYSWSCGRGSALAALWAE